MIQIVKKISILVNVTQYTYVEINKKKQYCMHLNYYII